LRVKDIDRVKWAVILIGGSVLLIIEFAHGETLASRMLQVAIISAISFPLIIWGFGQIKQLTLELENYSSNLEKAVASRTVELEEAYTKVKELNELKDEILSTVSHEIKTPLMSVRGCIELLDDSVTSEEEKELISIAEKEANRLQTLIDDLVDVSGVSNFSDRTVRRCVPLGRLGKELIEEITSIAKEKKIQIEQELKDIEVVGDEQLLRRALSNILENALKFTAENGRVKLSVRPNGNGAEISVSDTGIGIPSKEKDRIFEKFYRLDRGDTKRYYGTGLGLTITKAIIDAHGGELTVDSAPGKGSTFTVQLPHNPDT